jgi:hypothetical protein
MFFQAGMAKLADAADLKSADQQWLWGFKSPSRHQLSSRRLPDWGGLYGMRLLIQLFNLLLVFRLNDPAF